MGQHSYSKERPENKAVKTKEMPRGLLVIRLVVASVIFAVASVVSMPAIVRTILLVIAVLVAGFDIILEAVNCVESGDYFGVPVILVFVAVIAFVIGFGIESAAMIILYKVGFILSEYVRERTLLSAEELLRYRSAEEIDRTVDTVNKPGAGETALEENIRSAASFCLKILIGFAVLFAVLAPLLTHLTYREAIHRALSIIVIATPVSVLVSLPLVGLIGIFTAARSGALFNRAVSVEKLGETRTAIIDKSGVLAEECPKLLSVQSDLLDTNTFLTFAAHAVYYSEQPIARALANATDGEYKLEVVKDFRDIPGFGVEVDIGNAHVILATKEFYISRGEAVPYGDENSENQIYYMVVAGRYVGKIEISNSAIDSVGDIVREFKNNGVERAYLLSEEGKEDVAAFASRFGFDDAFGELDLEKKLSLIEQICENRKGGNLYLYSSGIESHSKADVDIRVSKAGKYADALVNPNSVSALPGVLSVSGRMRSVASENAIFTMAIKAILVFLSINGWCNLWFAMFIDCAAMIFAELNAIRVSSGSILKGLLRHSEEDEYADD